MEKIGVLIKAKDEKDLLQIIKDMPALSSIEVDLTVEFTSFIKITVGDEVWLDVKPKQS